MDDFTGKEINRWGASWCSKLKKRKDIYEVIVIASEPYCTKPITRDKLRISRTEPRSLHRVRINSFKDDVNRDIKKP